MEREEKEKQSNRENNIIYYTHQKRKGKYATNTFPNSVVTFSISSIDPTVTGEAYCWITCQKWIGSLELNIDQRAREGERGRRRRRYVQYAMFQK